MAVEEDTNETPAKGGTKKPRSGVECTVLLLDGTEFKVELSKSAMGRELTDKVSEHLSLAEKDYFSCSYKDNHGVRFWVNDERPLSKAGKRAHPNYTFSFEVKFYPLTAEALHEDFTRYLLFLQTRVDIVMDKLPSSFVTLALLGSYAVQSDLGDYNEREHGTGFNYIRDIKFAAKQSEELLTEIAALHATHRGMVPSEAELSYLENAEKLAQYGLHMHRAKDSDGSDVDIGVGAIGLTIYKGTLRIHRLQWAKIMKIAYKRNTFTVKIRPEIPNEPQQMLIYKLPNNLLAKRLWRIAVEHHGFFRLKEPEPFQRAKFPHFGSKFRYSGRTQHQTVGTTDQPGRIVPKINRKASTRFIGARDIPLATNTAGYSTERGEQHTIEGTSVPTLDLKKLRRGNDQSESNPNLSVIDPGGEYGQNEGGQVTVSSTQVTYSKTGYQGPARYDQYGNPLSPGADSSIDEFSSQDGTMNSRYPAGSVDRREPPRGGSRYSSDADDTFGRSQEDQRYVQYQGDAGKGKWGGGFGTTTTSQVKTSTRTYTDSDGTVITEHITEKDGIIEKRIEKRQKTTTVTVTDVDDDFDHDKALRDAILGVTDLSTNMSVEKIEIQTKTETV